MRQSPRRRRRRSIPYCPRRIQRQALRWKMRRPAAPHRLTVLRRRQPRNSPGRKQKLNLHPRRRGERIVLQSRHRRRKAGLIRLRNRGFQILHPIQVRNRGRRMRPACQPIRRSSVHRRIMLLTSMRPNRRRWANSAMFQVLKRSSCDVPTQRGKLESNKADYLRMVGFSFL